MTILHIQLLFLLSSAALALYAAFFILHRLRDIDRKISNILMLTLQHHLKNNVDILNDMQSRLHSLVQEEQYEAAEQLRVVVESQKQNLRRQIEEMKKSFGDNVKIELLICGEKNDN